MTAISKSALLPYAAPLIFELVNDVAAYPAYMQGCVGCEILLVEAGIMEARLDLAKGPITQSFTTRNRLHPYERIQLELVEGPFSRFEGLWQFQALAESACKVSLDLEFEISNPIVNKAAQALFGSMGNNLVDAVCKRANDVYGK